LIDRASYCFFFLFTNKR